MKQIIPINAMPETCRTIKAQHYKASGANFIRQGSMGVTAVLEIGDIARCLPAHYYKAGWHDFDPTSIIPHTAILEIDEVALSHKEIMEEPQIKIAATIDSGIGEWPTRQDDKIYDTDGISPAIAVCRTNHVPNIMEEPKPIQVAQIYDQEQNPINGRVYSEDEISPTLQTPTGGLSEPKIVEPRSCAMRGRNVDNPSDRTAGIPTEQRLEIGGEIANCLTSVQKDSMIVEPCILGYTRDDKGNVTSRHEKEVAGTVHSSTGSGGNTDQFIKEPMIQRLIPWNRPGKPQPISPTMTISGWQDNNIVLEPLNRQDNIAYKRMPNGNIRAFDASTPDKRGISELQIVNPDNECPTITTAHEPKVLLHYRIRKLTERECFRLMDVSDSDIDKIEAHRIKVTLKNGTVRENPIPKSAKYKLAGNSIVVSCLYHLFRMMFIPRQPEDKKPRKIKQYSIFDYL